MSWLLASPSWVSCSHVHHGDPWSCCTHPGISGFPLTTLSQPLCPLSGLSSDCCFISLCPWGGQPLPVLPPGSSGKAAPAALVPASAGESLFLTFTFLETAVQDRVPGGPAWEEASPSGWNEQNWRVSPEWGQGCPLRKCSARLPTPPSAG